ncbi:hypothetical protein GGD50_001700 [Rhizobium paranaense]|uniref:Uncharacterized protein n=1 Tax=Rhizobium paranaense TaxID=1650438 RepID=A0A7W9D0T1_9HYPH|nr:hypothetical protein [Rhizobium paranaense]
MRVRSRGRISPDRERYSALAFGEKPCPVRLFLRSFDHSPEMELSRFFSRYIGKGEKVQSACSFVSSIEPDGISRRSIIPTMGQFNKDTYHDIQA